MKYYLDKIYKIMLHARSLLEAGEFYELEDYADAKLDEVVTLINKALKVRIAEDLRWEFYSTLTGAHYINTNIGEYHLFMSLNVEGDAPELQVV